MKKRGWQRRVGQALLSGAGRRACLALLCACSLTMRAQDVDGPKAKVASTVKAYEPFALSPEYTALQERLGKGWNTWDVNSVATQVLLPEGLAIHFGMKHNTTEGGDAVLTDMLIGRLDAGVERIVPGPHAWDGSYTDLHGSWKDHAFRLQSAHDGGDLVMLATPLPSRSAESLAATAIFSVNFLWNREGSATRLPGRIETQAAAGNVRVYCTCEEAGGTHPSAARALTLSPLTGPYFATDFTAPVAVSTGRARSLAEVQGVLDRERKAYQQSLATPAGAGPGREATERPIRDAIETTLGWDTIYEPEKGRVVSPVSRVWSVHWGGYVVFDWDTFFAADMASIGDRDLAYADAVETLRESTREGFVPNYARAGNWKSSDRSEPPVGAATVLHLYQKFGDRWLLSQAFPALLRWNEWWDEHRAIGGYLTWGSNGENAPENLDDPSRGTRLGAVLESGLDNSPMYDSTTFDPKTHLLELGDVGLMSLYIADCEALATMADMLGKTADAEMLRSRSQRYKAKLQTMWSPAAGIFLNKDLHTGKPDTRLSPTNFYPMLAHIATAEQARTMVGRHLENPKEFGGEWVIPAIARDDPAFGDQNYWRGRIWGPMNYLVYLGLRNYDLPQARAELANKSYALFLREWTEHGHVHENYSAVLGSGDDVANSDRFYHWGALLGLIQYLEVTAPPASGGR